MKKKVVIIVIGAIVLLAGVAGVITLVTHSSSGGARQALPAESSYSVTDAADTYELLFVPDTSGLSQDAATQLQITVKASGEKTTLTADYAGDGAGYVALVHEPGDYIATIEHEAIQSVDIYIHVDTEKVYVLYTPLEVVGGASSDGGNVIKQMWDMFNSFTTG